MTQYYIRNKHSAYLGNSPFWYGKKGNGYTAYILGAERFTEEQAMKMVNQDPTKWEAYKCHEVDSRLHLIYDSQDNKNLGTDNPCGWNSGYAPNPESHASDQQKIEDLQVALAGWIGLAVSDGKKIDKKMTDWAKPLLKDDNRTPYECTMIAIDAALEGKR